MIESLGSYKVLERMGAGGMGDVYRARDTRHGRTLAIKLLPAAITDDPERRARFLEDAHRAALLSHPNVVTLYEIGEEKDRLFLAFDFVPGETLKATIAGRPLNPRRAIDLAAQIADGLADAHAAGIVHGDIRSDSVIVTPRGGAKILDLGLTAWTTSATARVAGPYMPPEHALGKPPDERADIFSLGAVLFEMLTGKPPVATPSSGEARAPSTINNSLPPELDAIVVKALAKDVDHRYQSAAAMAFELRSMATVLDARSESVSRASVPVTARRRSVSLTGWFVLVIAVAALAAAWWMFYGR